MLYPMVVLAPFYSIMHPVGLFLGRFGFHAFDQVCLVQRNSEFCGRRLVVNYLFAVGRLTCCGYPAGLVNSAGGRGCVGCAIFARLPKTCLFLFWHRVLIALVDTFCSAVLRLFLRGGVAFSHTPQICRSLFEQPEFAPVLICTMF